MNIVVCVKRVPTTDAVLAPSADGKGIATDGLQYMISFYDEIALEQAVQTKEALGGEVTVLSIGPSSGTKSPSGTAANRRGSRSSPSFTTSAPVDAIMSR